MDTEIIFWIAVDLEPGCEMTLSFTTKQARDSVLKSLDIRQRIMVNEYNLYEAEQISFENEDAPNGEYLITIVRDLKQRK